MAKQVQKIFGGGGGGLPRGAGLGMKLLGAAAVIGVGINQSMYTGELAGRTESELSVCVCVCVSWPLFSFNS